MGREFKNSEFVNEKSPGFQDLAELGNFVFLTRDEADRFGNFDAEGFGRVGGHYAPMKKLFYLVRKPISKNTSEIIAPITGINFSMVLLFQILNPLAFAIESSINTVSDKNKVANPAPIEALNSGFKDIIRGSK